MSNNNHSLFLQFSCWSSEEMANVVSYSAKAVFLALVLVCGVSKSSASNVTTPQRVGIKMTKSNGVYKVPCLVNGVEMEFVFDTGASNVLLSSEKALYLSNNGYIDEEDIGEEVPFMLPDGSIVYCVTLKLKTIEVGGIVLRDIPAVVTTSTNTPLLLGQSAIEKLGRYEICGDSLFITGIVEYSQKSQSEEKVEYTIPPSNPKATFWDKAFTALGFERVVNNYCIRAWNAYKNSKFNLALDYCIVAHDCDWKSWKADAIMGICYLKMQSISYDYKQWSLYYLSHAISRNTKRETFYINSNDSISYLYLLHTYCYWATNLSDSKNNYVDDVLKIAHDGLKYYPQDARLMDVISWIYTRKKDYNLAKQWADDMVRIHPAMGYFRLACIEYMQGNYSKAIEYCDKNLEIEHSNADTQKIKRMCYSMLYPPYTHDNRP